MRDTLSPSAWPTISRGELSNSITCKHTRGMVQHLSASQTAREEQRPPLPAQRRARCGLYHSLQDRQAAWQHPRWNVSCTPPAICGILVLGSPAIAFDTSSQHHTAYCDTHSPKRAHKCNKPSSQDSKLLALMHHRQVGKKSFPSVLPHACSSSA